MPLGLPRSVWGICQESRNTPFDENFCTRPGHVHHVKVVLRVHGHRARLVELAHAHAAGADDLHALERAGCGAAPGLTVRWGCSR